MLISYISERNGYYTEAAKNETSNVSDHSI